MAQQQSADYWPKFWGYFKEAADHAAFTMPDPTKVGDWFQNGTGAILAFIAAAEVSSKTGQISMLRIINHMAATGKLREVQILSRMFGWVLRVNAMAPALGGAMTTGTVPLAGQISITIPGLAATAAGAAAAAYVGTVIGCLGYAQLRMMGFLNPETGMMGRMFAQFYGYDPQTEAATDYLLQRAKARSGAVRAAARINTVVPANLLNKY
ncbi:MAG: hypothetical protein NW208_15225 [Bryobacter sp.]|nr:hypothetical protein [Bryobacter sp.]